MFKNALRDYSQMFVLRAAGILVEALLASSYNLRK